MDYIQWLVKQKQTALLSMSQAELGWENNWAISPLLLRWDHVRNYLYTKMPQNVTK